MKKKFNLLRVILFLVALVLAPKMAQATQISVTDVDGRERILNGKGQVHVIIYSNEDVQDATRAASQALDEFKGLEQFNTFVVVDLRDSLANWAQGYTKHRMIQDLNTEAKRIVPFYRKNGNTGDPRKDISAVADFQGDVSLKLGWQETAETLRVIVFDQKGVEVARWEDLKDYALLRKFVAELLGRKS